MTLTKFNVPQEVEKKILIAIELKKELERYEHEIKEELTEAMEANNIYSIKNDSYTVTLATRKSYKTQDEVPAEFAKSVLDTAKVSAHIKLHGELPEGVSESETKYITWRAK